MARSLVSTEGMRHAYMSNKYKDTIKVQDEMAKDLTNMGSSILQQKTYIQS